jgi:hypothetical protein
LNKDTSKKENQNTGHVKLVSTLVSFLHSQQAGSAFREGKAGWLMDGLQYQAFK